MVGLSCSADRLVVLHQLHVQHSSSFRSSAIQTSCQALNLAQSLHWCFFLDTGLEVPQALELQLYGYGSVPQLVGFPVPGFHSTVVPLLAVEPDAEIP